MLPVRPRGLFIKKEAYEDPKSMARVEGMLPFVEFPGEPEVIDDDAWHALVIDEGLNRMPRHGRHADEVEPILVFNQFLYHHSPEERLRREERYPELFRGQHKHYSGYGGGTGAGAATRNTGALPAWSASPPTPFIRSGGVTSAAPTATLVT